MDKDFASWFHHQHSDRQSPKLNARGAPYSLGLQNTIPDCTSPRTNVVSTNGTLPGFPFSGVTHSMASPRNEPQGWFYCLPRFRQAFTPVPNSIFKEEVPAGPSEKREDVVTPIQASGCGQKRFLVFDQSGDQTTMILSSAIGTPVQCLTSWGTKLDSAYDLNKINVGTGKDITHCPGPILTDECCENHRDDVGSEMHEDTEELNALLESDDEDYSEDDEVASTGHSPSTMTSYGKQVWFEENAEEVASSAGPTKRMKLFDGCYDVPLLMDTASSVKPARCFDYEGDVESSCVDGKKQGLGEFGSLSGNKRSRKEKIQEMVSVLQNIIPGVKGKDSVAILDEAINYLRSLKPKAKEALGLDIL